MSVVAGRLSFVFGSHGLCTSVDAACASALVALQHAAQTVRQNESGKGIAFGISFKLLPYTTLAMSLVGVVSADGRCKTFDARANGMCRAEGVTAQLISSQPGQTEETLLTGIAARHDGKSASLTAPNARAQQIMLKDAAALSGVTMANISCVQAHGTGTALGDPTEVSALAAVFGSDRAAQMIVSSHKANIGHSEAPSGMIGLCKSVAALSKHLITGNAHLRVLSPILQSSMMMVKMPFTIPVQNVKAINPDHIGVTTMGHNGSIVHALSKEPAKEVIPIRRRKDGKIGFKRKAFEWVQTEKPKDRLRLWSTSWAPVAADEEAVPMAGKRLIVVKQGSSGAPLQPKSWKDCEVVIALDDATDCSLDVVAASKMIKLIQRISFIQSSARVTLLTSGAQPSATPMSPSTHIGGASHGGMWGFARVLRLEQPTMQVISADTVPGAVLSSAGKETELSLQPGSRLVARLRAGPTLKQVRNPIGKVKGCYVITGGLGGLGLRAAELVLGSWW